MSNISTLKDYLVTQAAGISETIDRYECLADIDSWYACRTAIDTIKGGKMTSYSIGGRSATYQDVGKLEEQERALYRSIKDRLYGSGIMLADLRTFSESVGSA